MEFKIGEQVKELRFSLSMINELDKKYVVEANGSKFAMGLNMAFTYLSSKNPTAIANVIKACLPQISMDKVEQAVEDYAIEHGTLEPLFDELMDEMGKHPLLTATLNNFKKTAKVSEPEEA